ncbi:MAG: hypothetical protein GX568_00170 [Candidatus Gastranaerophilales bacterium]|jgi:hypothetical protein|nr:hypothetical protein [Candidatus Gastranaerophilales bacterium]
MGNISKNWTKEEVRLLKKFYPSTISNEKLLRKFSGRNLSALAHKACKLGIKRGKYLPEDRNGRKWTQDEINMVRAFYGQVEDRWIQDFFPHRSIGAIKRIALKYGPKKKRKKIFSKNPSWTQFEDALLLKHYQDMTLEELTKLFPQRTYDAVRSRMWVLKLNRDKEYLKRAKIGSLWTDEEFKILKENINKSVKELQVLLPARSDDAIRGKRRRLV